MKDTHLEMLTAGRRGERRRGPRQTHRPNKKRKQLLCTTRAEAQFAETKVTDRKGTSTMRLEETGPTKLYILP